MGGYLKQVLAAVAGLIIFHTSLYSQNPVVITYVGGYTGKLINYKAIDAKKLTHIIYAFADVYKNRAHLNYQKTDDINLRRLGLLRAINPAIKILISVGGIGWSRNFSNMALADVSRESFAVSCTALMTKYKLDGVDIDWEFPGYAGEGGNIYRPEDKQNYTLLFKTLRHEFDRIQMQTGKRLLITTAVDGWGSHFLPHTEMDKVQLYTDYILIMAYNFNTKDEVGGHFLYTPKNWPPDGSADGAVTAFMQAGVPVQN